MWIIHGLKERKTREQKLTDDVVFLNQRIEDMEAEHEEELNKAIRKAVRDVGRWKFEANTLSDEKHQWSEDARALQDKIDANKEMQISESYLGLVRAVKRISNFKIPY